MLTATEKAQILYHLGYPAKTLVVGSTNYSKILADRFENLPAENEVIVRELLGDVEAVNEALRGAQARLAAKRVGDIETNPEEFSTLRGEKNRLIGLLGQQLDISVRKGGGMMVNVIV